MSSLRERNRLRARDDVLNAGVRLFRERGFTATTIGAIATEAGISRRTFFRYFTSKEDVALALEDLDREGFMAHLGSRPASEGPMEALSDSMLETMSLYDGPEHQAAADRLMESQTLIASSPALHAAYLRREALREEQATRIVAARIGVDSETDYRPRLWVALTTAAVNVALAVLLKSYQPGQPIEASAVLRNVFAASGLLDSADAGAIGSARRPGLGRRRGIRLGGS